MSDRRTREDGAVRRDLAAGPVIAAEGEVGPELLVLGEQLAHARRRVEARMRPQDARGRILAEEPLDGVGIGVRVQHQPVLLRELDHSPRHGQIRVGPVEVEFPDRHVAVLREPLLEVRDHRGVLHPGRDLAAPAIRPELGHDDVGCLGEQLLGAVVVRARHSARLTPAFRRSATTSFGDTTLHASWL